MIVPKPWIRMSYIGVVLFGRNGYDRLAAYQLRKLLLSKACLIFMVFATLCFRFRPRVMGLIDRRVGPFWGRRDRDRNDD